MGLVSGMYGRCVDPLQFKDLLWPHITFYRQQQDIIYSVVDNKQTFVPAGNMLGKDFVAGFIALWFFCTRTPCRVMTTSVDATQLEGVLWGEIRRLIQEARYPLTCDQGGPLLVNHLHIRQVINGKVDGLSYLKGRTAAQGEGMLGHHIANQGDGIPRTLAMCDEASGVDDLTYKNMRTWFNRFIAIGNCYPCENFFKQGVKAGDKWSKLNNNYSRKVIRITGHDSPNVRLGKYLAERGLPPQMAVPGVLPYDEYLDRLENWDPIAIQIGIEADFYEGAEVLMFPPAWLNRANELHEELAKRFNPQSRQAKGLGVDPAEGSDNTAWCVVDEYGILEMVSIKTTDTSTINNQTKALMRKWDLRDDEVCYDRGGGGKQHADNLRAEGYKKIRTVGFGAPITEDPKYGTTQPPVRLDQAEERYSYKNRRAQLYGEARVQLDPDGPSGGFAIPRGGVYADLRKQLSPIPLGYDKEGRMVIPPKQSQNPDEVTLKGLIGHSPDEADAFTLAIHAMLHKEKKAYAGPSSKGRTKKMRGYVR